MQIVEESANEKTTVEMKEISEQNITSTLSPAIAPEIENKADNDNNVKSNDIATMTVVVSSSSLSAEDIADMKE